MTLLEQETWVKYWLHVHRYMLGMTNEEYDNWVLIPTKDRNQILKIRKTYLKEMQ